ncbi:hypothetical protein ACIPSA_22805 [Streptomyces sp. NPDC086549]|uniref:hypothetical protein n=1 Tax=Streptomyces sp. NPDC086549 TaxID=3365752 RepID=UPI00382CA8FE
MFTKQRLIAAGATAILMVALAACGGAGADDQMPDDSVGYSSDTAAQDTEPPAEADTVSGLRDDVRHVSRRTVGDTRPHLVKECTSTTRRVRHTSTTGTGTRRSTRTWYTTQQSRTCKQVRSGTETYRRVVRPERWCVELDDVNGVTTEDDVWYRVDATTYDQAVGTDENTRMEFTPVGTGC